MAKIRKRVSFNLKPETIELIHEASKIFNEDMSKIVDDAIQFRLKYINKEKTKLEKEKLRQMNPKEWVDNYWENYKEENKNE